MNPNTISVTERASAAKGRSSFASLPLQGQERRGLYGRRLWRLELARMLTREILQELLDGEAFDPWFLPIRQARPNADDLLKDSYPNRTEILEKIAKRIDQFVQVDVFNGRARGGAR